MKKWVCILLFFIFLASLKAFSSSSKLRWGKLSPKDIELTDCYFDSAASAVILVDYGRLNYKIDEASDIFRHRKLKILKQSGSNYANVVLRYYSNNNIEYIKNLRAQTINFDQNGKVVKTKVLPKNIYEVKIDKNWSEIRFTFPDVNVGSVIEYQFTKVFNEFMPHFVWTFQSQDLPTLTSEYKVRIDDNLDVKTFYNSPRLLKAYGYEKNTHWVIHDLPSIRNEPFFYTTNDYIEKIKLQLVGIYNSNNSRNHYTNFLNTWGDLAGNILNSPSWSTYVSTSSIFVQDILKNLIRPNDTDEDKLKKIYYYVLSKYAWDGQVSIFPTTSLNQLLNKTEGNSAEINLLLNLLLNEAGIYANPVLISTKEHGSVSQYPLISEFNQVIVHAAINDYDVLLNATDDFRPYFLLAKTELNERGLLLDRKDLRWIPLDLEKYSVQFLYGEVFYTETSEIKYKLNYAFSGYYALENRKLISRQNSLEEYVFKYLIPKELYATIDSISYKNVFDIEGNLEISCYLSEKIDTTYSLSYIKPLLFNTIRENPFKSPDREYPVDFLYPFREISIYTIHYPNEVEVLEIPNSAEVRFAQNQAVYKYLSRKLDGNKVYVRSELMFNSTYYGIEYYPSLQQFFSKMLAKNEENITLQFK